MTSLATLVGRFIGAVLAECAPVIVEIIRHAKQNIVEDSAGDDALRARLLDKLHKHKDSADTSGGSGEDKGNDKTSSGVGA